MWWPVSTAARISLKGFRPIWRSVNRFGAASEMCASDMIWIGTSRFIDMVIPVQVYSIHNTFLAHPGTLPVPGNNERNVQCAKYQLLQHHHVSGRVERISS